MVAQGSFGAPTRRTRVAFMRYVGQGHEIAVALPAGRLSPADVPAIRAAYDAEYTRFYDRPVPGSDVEVMSYAVTVATLPEPVAAAADLARPYRARPVRSMEVCDTVTGRTAPWDIYDRVSLTPGAAFAGPAIVAEDETSTLVPPGWTGEVDRHGYLSLQRRPAR